MTICTGVIVGVTVGVDVVVAVVVISGVNVGPNVGVRAAEGNDVKVAVGISISIGSVSGEPISAATPCWPPFADVTNPQEERTGKRRSNQTSFRSLIRLPFRALTTQRSALYDIYHQKQNPFPLQAVLVISAFSLYLDHEYFTSCALSSENWSLLGVHHSLLRSTDSGSFLRHPNIAIMRIAQKTACMLENMADMRMKIMAVFDTLGP